MSETTAEMIADPVEKVVSLYPASYGQRRIWFFDRLTPGSAVYNFSHCETLNGPCDVDVARQALAAIVQRHEPLRTTFRNVDGTPVQVVNAAVPLALTHVDLVGQSEEQRDRACRQILREDSSRGFDLEHGPLIRFTLIELEARQQLLCFTAHHSIFDVWSIDVLVREFHSFYKGFGRGKPVSPVPLAFTYATFTVDQLQRFEGNQAADSQLDYWKQRLAGAPARSEFPIDRPRPAVQTYPGAKLSVWLDTEIESALRDMTRSANATMFMSLFAAFSVLLHRYCGQTDVVIGTPIANRARPGLGEMIGFFLNTLVLRMDFSDDPTVLTLLSRARQTALEAFAHQDVPFELLMEELKPERDPARSPLFQTLFVYHTDTSNREEPEGHQDAPMGSKFDLTLEIFDHHPKIKVVFEYNSDLFTPGSIDRLCRRFEQLLQSMAANPDQSVGSLDLLGAAEREAIVKQWNTTATEPAPAECAHRAIARFAATQPNALAVSQGAASLTYAGLDQRARALAARLRGLGVGRETRIGVCMGQTLDRIVAILGILRAGAAFVPIDTNLPAARLEFMIEDAGIPFVITYTAHAGPFSGSKAKTICLDTPLPAVAADAPPDEAVPSDLAYAVYTSGSTGKPKGVLVQHDSITNFAIAFAGVAGVRPGSRVLQFTPFGFDICLGEIFMTLCAGAQLCMATPDEIVTGPPLLRTLRDLRITQVTLPPSALAAMQPESLPDLQTLISAGEPCEPTLARRWAGHWRMLNAYGPTEVTVYATVGEFDAATGAFPVGRVLAGMQAYVLDRNGTPVPPGVIGEIHFGGIGISRGYLNRPELTAEKFIPDTLSGREGARLYKTGDLGRFDTTGTLHYLGRTDGQLKIRGYRIEPGEIEACLREHPGVTDAVVLAHGSGPDARLLAYIVPVEPPPLIVELRGFVAQRLPPYMAPAAYTLLKAWPKTANGKIDRLALPRPEVLTRDAAAAYVAPGNELEGAIAAIWRDCLGIQQVGVTDNFFDLGGHSLLVVRVYDQLKEKLKGQLSLIDLFRFPTVKLQAELLGRRSAGAEELDTRTLGRADMRAARQNAARQQRRRRAGEQTHA